MEKVKFKNDPTFLVAKGRFSGKDEYRFAQEKEHISKLSDAIFMAINKHGYAQIRAIGARAIANAVRAITNVTERCKKRNVRLLWESVVEKGNLGPIRNEGHVSDVVAYLFTIKHFEELDLEVADDN